MFVSYFVFVELEKIIAMKFVCSNSFHESIDDALESNVQAADLLLILGSFGSLIIIDGNDNFAHDKQPTKHITKFVLYFIVSFYRFILFFYYYFL